MSTFWSGRGRSVSWKRRFHDRANGFSQCYNCLMMNLSQFTWARKTDLARGQLAPKDAVILLLKDGPVTRKRLIKALQEWRPRSTYLLHTGERVVNTYNIAFYTYLFHRGYGHAAVDSLGTTGTYAGTTTKRSPHSWHYAMKRGLYALTITGIRRLHELGF